MASELQALCDAVYPLLRAYKHTEDGHITKEQIEAAWSAYEEARAVPERASDAEGERWLLYWPPGDEQFPRIRWGDSPRPGAKGYVTVEVVPASLLEAAHSERDNLRRNFDAASGAIGDLRSERDRLKEERDKAVLGLSDATEALEVRLASARKALEQAGRDFRTIAGKCSDEEPHPIIDTFAMESSDRTSDALANQDPDDV